jgi:hypothetical protein
VPVVLAFECEDPFAAGRDPREPDHVSHRLRRGQRELPFRHAPSLGQLLGHDDRVFGRQSELHAPLEPVDRRRHDRGMRVARRGDGDVQVHVEVTVPVDIGEVRAVGRVDEDRWVIEEPVHPRHRDA